MRGVGVNRRVLGASAAAVALGLLIVAPAFACGATSGNISATPSPVDAGAPVKVTGVQWMAAPEGKTVTIHWGGKSAAVAASAAPAPDGGFTETITAPAGAASGSHQITAVQEQLKEGQWVTQVASTVVEVRATAPAPAPQPQPAPVEPTPAVQPAPAAQPAAQVAPTPAPVAAAAPTAAERRSAAAQAAAEKAAAEATAQAAAQAAAQASSAAAAPAAAGSPPPGDNGGAVPPSGAPAPAVETVPALPERPADLGRPRQESGSGTPAWLVALIVGGVALSAGSCAAVVSDVRKRRSARQATPAKTPDTTNRQ